MAIVGLSHLTIWRGRLASDDSEIRSRSTSSVIRLSITGGAVKVVDTKLSAVSK